MANTRTPKPLRLITMNTPKGQEVQIVVEELRLCYEVNVVHMVVDVRTGMQKQPGFLRLNPNGKIPVLIDNNHDAINTIDRPFCVMESGAICRYLCSRFDTKRVFYFSDPCELSEMEQWVAWGLSTLNPATDECIKSLRHSDQRDDSAVKYLRDEVILAYTDLENHLQSASPLGTRLYLAGNGQGKFSIADMIIWPWINVSHMCGLREMI
ncbi:hypothetical protein, variant 1 [Puccinia triticina 1-1 BBBD Race 1]|uniref:GST N-terminal domain-containing protein n=2 Tax=Puccinia triticina TaxID=208348 RepID=A0A180G5B2_PUCT1|nr:uncharacterized protein PtA15_3A783 [Puccinia triticina]OAV87790.1 hypothetical protein, variant 1 [Puccinia triticina 1-1 BBBD Race 1]WAQ83413.1 hypothetical protein PtA15_3A783 [Puccinia triticina]